MYDEKEDHPPIREYVWSAQPSKLEVMEEILYFTPGIAVIAPCTSLNYNLEQVNELEFIIGSLGSKNIPRMSAPQSEIPFVPNQAKVIPVAIHGHVVFHGSPSP